VNVNGGGPHNSYGQSFSNVATHQNNPSSALANIESLDSDGDAWTNLKEIQKRTFPGNASSFPTPSISSISPTQKQAGGSSSFTLFVFGQNFRNGSIVRVNGSNRTTTFFSENVVRATIPPSDFAAVGNRTITVRNPSPSLATSNSKTLTITAAPPPPDNDNFADAMEIDAVAVVLDGEPFQHIDNTQGATSQGIDPPGCLGQSKSVWYRFTAPSNGTLAVNTLDTNYQNAILALKGSPGNFTLVKCATSVAGTQVAFPVTTGTTYHIMVRSTGVGGGDLRFRVNLALSNFQSPPPTIAALSPPSVPLRTDGLILAVTGGLFTDHTVVRWNGQDRPTTFVSHTELRATIPAGDLILPGPRSVTVFTPGAGGVSNAVNFPLTGVATAFDFDGDGKADLGVYRTTTAEWFIFGSATGFPGPILLGSPGLGDVPVPADYDGDGKTDLAV
jgi:hypothetical protein